MHDIDILRLLTLAGGNVRTYALLRQLENQGTLGHLTLAAIDLLNLRGHALWRIYHDVCNDNIKHTMLTILGMCDHAM